MGGPRDGRAGGAGPAQGGGLNRRVIALGLGAAVAVSGTAAAWWADPPPEAPPRETPAERPTERAIGLVHGPKTARTGAEQLGINEGVSVRVAGNIGSPSRESSTLRRRGMQVRELGATMVRAGSHTYPYLSMDSVVRGGFDWAKADRYFDAVGRVGLEPILVLGPWPGLGARAHTDHYLPADLDAYEAYVTRVVERYDGDGIDDMPGLAGPVLAWEIDNEPDFAHGKTPRGGDFQGTFATPEEYATVLIATSRAIRRADADAFVLSGGIARPMTPEGRAYLEAVLAVPGAKEAFDGLSLHCYFVDPDLAPVRATMDTARALAPGKPVWITETSVPSDERQPWATDEWQGRMAGGVIGAFLAEGADRIFWHSLSDPLERGTDVAGVESNSLLGSVDGELVTWEKKPSGEVFSRLAERLAEVDPASLREIEAGEGRLLETDRGWLAFWGSPRVPEGAGAIEDLRTGAAVPASPTVEAPAWIAR